MEGAREAAFRGAELDVIHVVDSLDRDIAEANRAGISDAIEKALADDKSLQGREVGPAPRRRANRDVDDVVRGDPRRRRELAPDLLVIGARRRSPMGKAFLGSVTQNLILDADVPVLVVKSPR